MFIFQRTSAEPPTAGSSNPMGSVEHRLKTTVLEAMVSFVLKSTHAGARLGGQTVNNLRFTDDIDLVAEDDGQLQELTDEVHSSSQRFWTQN